VCCSSAAAISRGAEGAYGRADGRGHADGACRLGALLERQGNLEDARAAYERADRRRSPDGSFKLGTLLQARGDLAPAEEAFVRADDLGHGEAASSLAVLLQRRGELERADAALQRALDRGYEENGYNRGVLIGILLQRSGNLDGAAAAWRRVRSIALQEASSESVLERLRGERSLNGPGVELDAAELADLLRGAASPDAERTTLPDLNFSGATFKGEADFSHVIFAGTVNFAGATFAGKANFAGARFTQTADFTAATFAEDADFAGTTFCGDAYFARSIFTEYADYAGASFEGMAYMFRTAFGQDVDFSQVNFSSDVAFAGAQFAEGTYFADATFSAFANFAATTFAQSRRLGPAEITGRLALQEATFDQPIRIELRGGGASFERTVFRSGASVFLTDVDLALDDTDFGQPSLVADFSTPPRGADSGVRSIIAARQPLDLVPSSDYSASHRRQSRVLSLRRAKVAQLTLAGIDLTVCRFEEAHGLDQLRLERVRFPRAPGGWQWMRSGVPHPVRWTPRQVLAEEHRWRAEETDASGWYGPSLRPPEWLESTSRLTPSQIASIYRALRKGREDNKDEPGAADFYYGEMEMRRQRTDGSRIPHTPTISSRRTPLGERALLWAYWLLSGYALRAGRALAALGVVVILFAVLFDTVGFRPAGVQTRVVDVTASGSLSYERVEPVKRSEIERAIDATTYSLGTATAIISAPERPLTRAGTVLRVVLRILGPILVALAVFSVRGRVKR
jgi:tetratricopeptide (TPR) repeat protein